MVRAPAGAASSRSRRLAANTRTASSSAACHNRTLMSTDRCIRMRVRQAQCTVAPSHGSAARPWSLRPNRPAIRASYSASSAPGSRVRSRTSSFSPRNRASTRCDGQPRERLAELEVVGELGPLLLLARADPGGERAAGGHRLAQLAEQVRVLGEPLDQDGAGTLQGGVRVGDAPVRVDEVRGLGLRVPGGIGEEQARPAAPVRPRGRSAPWSAASACRAGRGLPAGPWSRPRGSGPRARRSACPGSRSPSGSRPGARQVRAGSAAVPRACAAGRRRGRRWPPCGTGR